MFREMFGGLLLVGTLLVGGSLGAETRAASDSEAPECGCSIAWHDPAEAEVVNESEATPADDGSGGMFSELVDLSRRLFDLLVAAIWTAEPAEMTESEVIASGSILDRLLDPEDLDDWFESQPRDEFGRPILTEDELAAIEREAHQLAQMLRDEPLDVEQRARIETTLIVKVALVDAWRLGSDRRAELFALLDTADAEGRRIDDAEAALLLEVLEGCWMRF